MEFQVHLQSGFWGKKLALENLVFRMDWDLKGSAKVNLPVESTEFNVFELISSLMLLSSGYFEIETKKKILRNIDVGWHTFTFLFLFNLFWPSHIYFYMKQDFFTILISGTCFYASSFEIYFNNKEINLWVNWTLDWPLVRLCILELGDTIFLKYITNTHPYTISTWKKTVWQH